MISAIVTIGVRGRCPLETIAELGGQSKNAWIFMHETAIDWLKKNSITIIECDGFTFNTGNRIVRVRKFSKEWFVLEKVTVGDRIHEFQELAEDPTYFIRIKMV